MTLLAVVVALAVSGAPEGAEGPQAPDAPKVHALRHDWVVDGAVTGGGAALFLASDFVFKDALAPRVCRWCDRRPDGTDTLNGLDAATRSLVLWPAGQIPVAKTLSDLSAFVVAPLAALGLDAYLAASNGALEGWGLDALVILEAAVASGLATQVVKFTAGRERPFVHALPEAEKLNTGTPLDNNMSFYSGHSSSAFAFLGAAVAVSQLRGYRGSWILWAVALPLAATAPYLRMAADRHYLTDVLTGAVLGGAIGYLVPVLFHGRADGGSAGASSMHLNVGPGSMALKIVFE